MITASGPRDDEGEGVEAETRAYNKSIATSHGSSMDNNFGEGMAGLFGRSGGRRFRNVQITSS